MNMYATKKGRTSRVQEGLRARSCHNYNLGLAKWGRFSVGDRKDSQKTKGLEKLLGAR